MRILVVEDERDLAVAIAASLRAEGFGTDIAGTVEDARYQAEVHPYDAVVLDRRLPDGEGLDLLRDWRGAGVSTPVLMLTALSDTGDVVDGLESGADDYLSKPFATEVLIARLRSLIRRGPVLRKTRLEVGGVEIDPARRRVRRDGVVVPLTSKEFALLEFLAHRAGEVVERLDILEHCWDHAYEPESNVVDVHVRSLRRKLGDDVIETVRGAGYRVPDDEEEVAEPAAPALPPSGTVTVLFSDIVESTDTTERIGDRGWLALLSEHNAIIREQLPAHGGFEVKSTGDGFMLAFTSARQGIACAQAIQRALADRNARSDVPIHIRIGLHTGEPIWGDGDFHGRGIALAARIGAKAEAGEILVSDLLRQLTESLGDFEFSRSRDAKLKGLAGRHKLHTVDW